MIEIKLKASLRYRNLRPGTIKLGYKGGAMPGLSLHFQALFLYEKQTNKKKAENNIPYIPYSRATSVVSEFVTN